MEETLIQPSRVQDEGPLGRKLLLYTKNSTDLSVYDGSI
jgi:hypothetical protein